MANLIGRTLRNMQYRIEGLVYKTSIHGDVLRDRLKRYGVSPAELNRYLDSHNFPREIGRFPRIVEQDERIAEVALQAIDTFANNPNNRNLTSDQRRDALIEYVSKTVAHEW
jgi:hypothetical protein